MLPPSVKAELDDDPAVQAVLTDVARQHDQAHREGGGMSYLMMGDDGEFHKIVYDPEAGLRPLSDAEVRELLSDDGEV